MLAKVVYAKSRAEAERRRREFEDWCRSRGYTKAAETLGRDWERMLTFYRYPKEHWVHIRTTNVVESPFAALRLRTDAAKRFKKVERATAVILPGHRGGTVRLPGLRGGDGADPPPRRTGEPKTR